MSDFTPHFENLLKDIKTRQLVFFVGAGVSFNSGVPTVLNIYEQLAKTLDVSNIEWNPIVNGKPFESVMAILLREKTLKAHFHLLFNQEHPTTSHYFLAHQLINNNTENVLTTNFDQLIEIAYQQLHGKPLNMILPSCGGFQVTPQAKSIIKLHGCISQGVERLGLTINAVANETNKENVKTALKTVLGRNKSSRLIFLGYSGSDAFDIGPALKELLGPDNYIYHVEHLKTNGFKVDKLAAPFNYCPGVRIEGDTDALIKQLWDATINEPYTKIGVTNSSWRNAFNNWKLEINRYNGLKEKEFLGHAATALSQDMQKGIEYGRDALKILKDNADFGNPIDTALIQNQLAQRIRRKYNDTGDKSLLNEALALALESLNTYEASNNHKKLTKNIQDGTDEESLLQFAADYCNALGTMGQVKRSLGDYGDAISRYNKVIKVSTWARNDEKKSATLMNIGFIHVYCIPASREGLSFYTEAAKLSDRFPLNLVGCYEGIANAHLKITTMEHARKEQLYHYEQALQASHEALGWASRLGAKTIAADMIPKIQMSISALSSK